MESTEVGDSWPASSSRSHSEGKEVSSRREVRSGAVVKTARGEDCGEEE